MSVRGKYVPYNEVIANTDRRVCFWGTPDRNFPELTGQTLPNTEEGCLLTPVVVARNVVRFGFVYAESKLSYSEVILM